MTTQLATTTATAMTPEQSAKFQSLVLKAQTALQEKARALLFEILQNLPEYTQYEWIQCIKWDYGRDVGSSSEDQIRPALYTFKVSDPDSDCDAHNTKTASPEDLAPTLMIMWMMRLAGEIKPYGLDEANFWDPCCWDAEAMDLLLQLHFYGEVVYG